MRTSLRAKMIAAAFLLFTIATTIGLSQEKSADRPTFEVATIKPSNAVSEIGGPYTIAEHYFAWKGRSLKTLILNAYRVRSWQLIGGPDWMNSDLWDIEARAKAEGAVSKPGSQTLRMLEMLQSLLEDRFRLKIQRETKESPVYNLVVAKGGPKIKLDGDQSPASLQGSGATTPSGSGWTRAFEISGRAAPMERLVQSLMPYSDRPIIDRTNLKGLYTYNLKWPEENSGPGDSPLARRSLSFGPAFFTALQEQLGLQLESAKGPVEFFVIKSVQKPEGIK
jgi:uncharacterized protein (TIGR03435 family)